MIWEYREPNTKPCRLKAEVLNLGRIIKETSEADRSRVREGWRPPRPLGCLDGDFKIWGLDATVFGKRPLSLPLGAAYGQPHQLRIGTCSSDGLHCLNAVRHA